MQNQKERIISKLEKFKVKYVIVNDELIVAFLLYVTISIIIKENFFTLECDDFSSKNTKKDIARLEGILREKRTVNIIQPLEYFENKYR